MLWQRMNAGETPIENDIALHLANKLVFERMAAAQGYDADFDVIDDTWVMAAFTKRRSRFSVVEGGKP
jgi:hypothetical protein